MKIEKGKKYLCISKKANSHFTKGEIYTSGRDGSLIDNNGNMHCISLWIKYFEEEKEKTYSLTKEQLKSITDPQVKQWFPEVFETFLEAGKWYKNSICGGSLFFATQFDANDKNAKGYGFENGEWYTKFNPELYYWNCTEKFEPATESEIFEALRNEAVKRGLIKGVYFRSLVTGETIECLGTYELASIHNERLCFLNGQWAEIIPTKTKAEAEKELNCKIVD